MCKTQSTMSPGNDDRPDGTTSNISDISTPKVKMTAQQCDEESSSSPSAPTTSSSPPSVDKTKPQQCRGGYFDTLPAAQQFVLLALAMFVFFGAHNVLQEAIMALPGFNFGVMLGYLEVIGVTVCSFLERKFIAKESGRKAPISAYPLLTLCLLGSSALSNASLNYINFPTKVVFRSCKLVPTMAIATLINKRYFTGMEYACALAVSFGLVFFTAADWRLTPSFDATGIILVSLSVVCDSVLPNAQERLFALGSSRLEVTFYTNLFTLIAMTVITLATGDLVGIVRHAMSDRTLVLYMAVFTAVAYVAISTYMQIVKRFGGVAAVLLTTARKGMTLVLSFLLFPKAFHWFYAVGAILVLGGLLAASLIKQKERRRKDLLKAASKEAELYPLKEKSTNDFSSVDLEMGAPSTSVNAPSAPSAIISTKPKQNVD